MRLGGFIFGSLLALTLVFGDQFIVPRPPSSSSCVLPNYPDATCTGVPVGTSLSAYAGPTTITTNGTTIDSKTISSCLTIQAQNVTIKNSRITVSAGCGDANAAVFLTETTGWSNWSVTIQDSEIDCGGDPPGGFDGSTGVGSAYMTLRRVQIKRCENGADVNRNFDIQDSYIYDLRQCQLAECPGSAPDGSHTDGLQFETGHFDPPGTGTVVNGVVNVTVTHNTIFSMKAGAHTPESTDTFYTTSAIISNTRSAPDTDANVVVTNNLFAGGAYTVYCSFVGTIWTFTGNHFSNRYKSTIGFFGPQDGHCDDDIVDSSNKCHESGATFTSSTTTCS